MSSPTAPNPPHDEPLPAATIAIGVTLGLFAIIVAVMATTATVFLVYKCWCQRRRQYTALPGSSGIEEGVPLFAECSHCPNSIVQSNETLDGMISQCLVPFFYCTLVDVGVAQTTSSQPVLGRTPTHSADNIYESMKGRDSRSGDESTTHFLTNPLYGTVESESAFQGSHDKVSLDTSPCSSTK